MFYTLDCCMSLTIETLKIKYENYECGTDCTLAEFVNITTALIKKSN